MAMVPCKRMVYVEDRDAYLPVDDVPEGSRSRSISGTELQERVATGRGIPEWFTFAPVASELRKSHPPRQHQGFTAILGEWLVILMTGLVSYRISIPA